MKKITSLILSIAIFLSITASAQTVKLTPAEKKLAEAITAAQIKNYLYFVASDAMGGRDTPSQGLDVTAEFLKMNLEKWGFKPAGDNGTFFQKITLRRESVDPGKTWLKMDGKSFALGDDFLRLRGNGTAAGEVVFVGDGWLVKSKGLNPYQGIDVKGKFLLISAKGLSQATIAPRPAGVTPADLSGTKGVDWADPVEYARQNQAAGILVIPPEQFFANWAQIKNFLGRSAMYPEKLRSNPGPGSELPIIMLGQSAASALLTDNSLKAPAALGKQLEISLSTKADTATTQNVVALWEGSDPVLKQEMVAIGAHYDHVGTNPNAPGEDKIWNGADDDGSGTVAVLSIAEALAKAKIRPKRSVLFVWHCGEEKGLWGSEYFNKYPTVDIKNVIAQLNIDMIGRSLDPAKLIKCDMPNRPCNEELSGPNEIYVIGKDMMSSELGRIVDQTNQAYLNLKYNTRYDDPNDKNRFFFRSDHFNYAQNGIPIAFWFDGVHEDYHQPSDSPDKIDYAKMEKVTRTIFLTLWELTNVASRPKVDKQLPPELTQR
ncbi:MAG TPA: M20/M25/M40 family metallo-hydrolase [Pyrinomonadaceae bacterium]|jgi:hypothetical protein|nr:M20/M25/M40 family metallo-hydrolase [Pyrinomonadaceae bacterium]